MKKTKVVSGEVEDSLLPEVVEYLNKFDFPLAFLIQKKFKIGFSRAERILRQIEAKKRQGGLQLIKRKSASSLSV